MKKRFEETLDFPSFCFRCGGHIRKIGYRWNTFLNSSKPVIICRICAAKESYGSKGYKKKLKNF